LRGLVQFVVKIDVEVACLNRFVVFDAALVEYIAVDVDVFVRRNEEFARLPVLRVANVLSSFIH
jgi:hypothetical protein